MLLVFLAALTAGMAILSRQFSLYLEDWRYGKKICFGHIVSIDDMNHSKDVARFLIWLARFLGIATGLLLFIAIAMRAYE